MRNLLTAILFGTVLSVAGVPSMAADKPKPTPEETFKKMDKNSDSKLSLEEFIGKRTAEKADAAKKAFARLDKNSDGSLDLEEFKAPRKAK